MCTKDFFRELAIPWQSISLSLSRSISLSHWPKLNTIFFLILIEVLIKKKNGTHKWDSTTQSSVVTVLTCMLWSSVCVLWRVLVMIFNKLKKRNSNIFFTLSLLLFEFQSCVECTWRNKNVICRHLKCHVLQPQNIRN